MVLVRKKTEELVPVEQFIERSEVARPNDHV